jgi:hypothetical protein
MIGQKHPRPLDPDRRLGRDRAIDSICANSSAPMKSCTTRRGAAVMLCHDIDTLIDYKAPRDRGNPPLWINFMESMY